MVNGAFTTAPGMAVSNTFCGLREPSGDVRPQPQFLPRFSPAFSPHFWLRFHRIFPENAWDRGKLGREKASLQAPAIGTGVGCEVGHGGQGTEGRACNRDIGRSCSEAGRLKRRGLRIPCLRFEGFFKPAPDDLIANRGDIAPTWP